MRTRTIAFCNAKGFALAASAALLLGSSLAAAQAATQTQDAAPAAAPDAAPVPAASGAGASPQPAPVVQPGTSTQPVAGGEAVPPVAPVSGAQVPQAQPLGAAGSGDANANAAQDTAAEVEAEQTGDAIAEDLTSDATKTNIYGFADFTFSSLLSDKKAGGGSTGVGPYPTFYVGNLNVYFDSDLGKKFHSLFEVRFTYLPDGANMMDPTTFQTSRISAAYPDYTDYGRNKKVGGVMIERAYLEYAAHPLFNIRMGQWLTPYGIWNVDHGSPVILGITRPYIVGSEWLPQRQTGIETYGSHGIDNTQVGYHLTVSNGRGPVDSYMDLDKNKAVGWRLWVKQDTPFGLVALGTSGYRGRYTDAQIAFGADPTVVSTYDELGLAADLKYTWGGFLFQAEYISRETRYPDGYRPTNFMAPGWTPDNRTWGYYFQTGYRLPWLGIMPWIGYEYDRLGKSGFLYESCDVVGGINMRPTDNVVLKVVGLHVWMPYLKEQSNNMDQLMAQVAWSF